MRISFMVTSAALLEGVKPGDKVRFTIDADQCAIVDVVPFRE
jgi:Cu/Ag efflux protein CusF